MRLRWLGLASLVVSGCAHFVVRSSGHYYEDSARGGARVVVVGGVALAEARGTPEEIGQDLGALTAEPLEGLRDALIVENACAFDPMRPRARSLEPWIPADYARELR